MGLEAIGGTKWHQPHLPWKHFSDSFPAVCLLLSLALGFVSFSAVIRKSSQRGWQAGIGENGGWKWDGVLSKPPEEALALRTTGKHRSYPQTRLL